MIQIKKVTVTPPLNISTVHNKQTIIIMDKVNKITNKVSKWKTKKLFVVKKLKNCEKESYTSLVLEIKW